ncbi:hypothetical protein EDD85DRAFT_848590 [Armillaria nabsnona]|nr:hypothetical protein EDD85DRAFT_848590 [Armillaria nabsnona]
MSVSSVRGVCWACLAPVETFRIIVPNRLPYRYFTYCSSVLSGGRSRASAGTSDTPIYRTFLDKIRFSGLLGWIFPH